VRIHYLRCKFIPDEINRLVSEGRFTTHNEAVICLERVREQWPLKRLNEAIQRGEILGAGQEQLGGDLPVIQESDK
jgi:hypothetical protein